MLYYGKLRKHREFLYAEKLLDKDKLFFDHWFNRCRNGNSLMPFLEKKPNNKVWLFIIISNSQLYIGLTAASQDLSERQFPFICFDILPISEQGLASSLSIVNEKIAYFIQKTRQFTYLIQDGKLNQEVLSSFHTPYAETELLSPSQPINFLTGLANNPELHIANQSCWLEIKSGFFITYQNSLTCSLYNKIYG